MLLMASRGVGSLEWQDSVPADELIEIWREFEELHRQEPSETPSSMPPWEQGVGDV